jgi:citrate lyase subunit beta/citryl-CoA lyase
VSSGTFSEARSFFIAAGVEEERLHDALASSAHAVIADFEDLVAPERKAEARSIAKNLFVGSSNSLKLVRVNAPDTDEFQLDLAALSGLTLDGVVVPKGTPDLVARLGAEGLPLLALVESGEGVRLAYETACNPRVAGLVIAPGDLSKDLKMQLRPDGQSLLYTRSKLVVDSAAAGIRGPIDIPSASEGDALADEVAYARSLGLWGKLCMKPGQAEVINDTFAALAAPAPTSH